MMAFHLDLSLEPHFSFSDSSCLVSSLNVFSPEDPHNLTTYRSDESEMPNSPLLYASFFRDAVLRWKEWSLENDQNLLLAVGVSVMEKHDDSLLVPKHTCFPMISSLFEQQRCYVLHDHFC